MKRPEKIKYCDNCDWLNPKEDKQTDDKEPHICTLLPWAILRHSGQHPRIPVLVKCPLNKIYNDWETYYNWATTELRKKCGMLEEKAKEQYEQKWVIIKGLPSEKELKSIINQALVKARMTATPVGNVAKVISKRLKEKYGRK